MFVPQRKMSRGTELMYCYSSGPQFLNLYKEPLVKNSSSLKIFLHPFYQLHNDFGAYLIMEKWFIFLFQLLPNLYHVGGTSWAGPSGLLSGPIQETLESMAGEVTRVVDEQLKVCGFCYFGK